AAVGVELDHRHVRAADRVVLRPVAGHRQRRVVDSGWYRWDRGIRVFRDRERVPGADQCDYRISELGDRPAQFDQRVGPVVGAADRREDVWHQHRAHPAARGRWADHVGDPGRRRRTRPGDRVAGADAATGHPGGNREAHRRQYQCHRAAHGEPGGSGAAGRPRAAVVLRRVRGPGPGHVTAIWSAIGWEVEVAAAIMSGATIGRWDQSRWDSAAAWSHTDTSLGDWLDITCDA